MSPDLRISWVGMLSGELKWGAFLSAEAFILPSHQENFGITVVQAMACGLPVLITYPINIWRDVESYHAGLIAKDDLNGVTELLDKWYNLPRAEILKLSQNGKRAFSEKFTMNAFFESLISAIQRHLANG